MNWIKCCSARPDPRDAKLILDTAAKYGVPVDMLWKPTGSAVTPPPGFVKGT